METTIENNYIPVAIPNRKMIGITLQYSESLNCIDHLLTSGES